MGAARDAPTYVGKTVGVDGKEFKIEKPLAVGVGAESDVYTAILVGDQSNIETKFVIKILKTINETDPEGSSIAERESKLLQRIYTENVHLGQVPDPRDASSTHPCIVMPFLPGMELQDKNDQTPAELKRLSFSERADLAYQYFEQLEKLHDAKGPSKAIIGDLHGGNIKIDFDKHPPKLYLFDFGLAIFTSSADIQAAPKTYTGGNSVACAPEFRSSKTIGLVSDIYGSVAPIALIFGAKNPGEGIRKGRLKEGEGNPSLNLDGLLEEYNIPGFVIPLEEIMKAFINKMKEEDPQKRIQSAAEGKEFFFIIRQIANKEFQTVNEQNMAAARLIYFAAGLGPQFDQKQKAGELKDSDFAEIVLLYNTSYPISRLAFIEKLTPGSNAKLNYHFEPSDSKEFILAYYIDPKATLQRLQLLNLLDELITETKSREKGELFKDLLSLAKMDYLDQGKTKEILQIATQIAICQTGFNIKNTTGTGGDLKSFLGKPQYDKLASLIPMSPGEPVRYSGMRLFAGSVPLNLIQLTDKVKQMKSKPLEEQKSSSLSYKY